MDNTINSLVSQTVGVTDQQIRDYLTNNPGMSDAQIVDAMRTYGVSPTQMASAVGLPVGEVVSRIAATVPPGQTVTVGDTVVQPQYQTTGSGQDEQVGGLQNVITYKTDENKTGGNYNQYSATGELERQGTQQKVDTSLGGVVKDIVSNPGFQIAALAYGGNALGNALGTGAGSAFEALNAGAGAFEGGTALNTLAAMTPAELAAFEAQNAGASAMTNLGASSSLTPALAAGGTAGLMGTGGGLTVGGAGGLGGAAGASGLGGSLGSGLGALTPGGRAAGNSLIGGSALGSTLGG